MKNNYLPIILTATAFGLLAGGAGALFANYYSASSGGGLALNRELNLSNYGYLSSNLVIRDPKKVVVNQDVKTDETIRDLAVNILGVFPKEANPEAYYELNQPFAQALAATTDGWIMATWPKAPTKTDLENIAANYIVIDSSRKLYEIDKVLSSSDKIGSFVFIHLKNASGLSVRRLVPNNEIKTGQSLLLATNNDSFSLNALGAKVESDSLLSSDSYSQSLRLAYNDGVKPSFVFNLSGEIIGAIDWQGTWLSGPELDAYWRSLLKSKTLSWPYFGVNYLNLSSVVGSSTLPEKGARLQDNGDDLAVLKNSPAEKAGLKAGDIITRLNGVELNSENNLSALLSAYNPGDSVTVNYLRNGAGAETEVILGSIQK